MVATIAIIGIMIPTTIEGDVSPAVTYLKDPLSSLSENPSQNELKEAIVYVAQKYLLDESELLKTLECESSFRHYNVYGDSTLAYGIAQFHKETFTRNCKGDYYSAKDQLVCMAQMWKRGMKNHWTCWSIYFSN